MAQLKEDEWPGKGEPTLPEKQAEKFHDRGRVDEARRPAGRRRSPERGVRGGPVRPERAVE